MPKRGRVIESSSSEEEEQSLSSVRIKDKIDRVLSEIKRIKKPGTMTLDEDAGGWKPYKPSKKDAKELKRSDDELFEFHQQQEEARGEREIPSNYSFGTDGNWGRTVRKRRHRSCQKFRPRK